MDIEMVEVVESTATLRGEVLTEVVILKKGDQYGVARRDWKANQWTNIKRSQFADRAGSLTAGWQVCTLQRNLGFAQKLLQALTERPVDWGAKEQAERV